MKLTDTQTIILNAAANRDDGLAIVTPKLPAAARNAVARSLEKNGLLEQAAGVHFAHAWRQADDGTQIGLRITGAGLTALGVDMSEWPAHALQSPTEARTAPEAGEAPQLPPEPASAPQESLGDSGAASSRRTSLRDVAAAVLAAWDGLAEGRPTVMDEPMATLRSALAGRSSPRSEKPRAPREGTKQQAVLALLRRSEGATIAQIAEPTGWAAHTVRGFLAGLKKKGVMIKMLDRVRMVGPGKAGARGYYTIYHIQDAA